MNPRGWDGNSFLLNFVRNVWSELGHFQWMFCRFLYVAPWRFNKNGILAICSRNKGRTILGGSCGCLGLHLLLPLKHPFCEMKAGIAELHFAMGNISYCWW